jgi:hypothetical protein
MALLENQALAGGTPGTSGTLKEPTGEIPGSRREPSSRWGTWDIRLSENQQVHGYLALVENQVGGTPGISGTLREPSRWDT